VSKSHHLCAEFWHFCVLLNCGVIVTIIPLISHLHFSCNQLIKALSEYCCCSVEIRGSADQSAVKPTTVTIQQLAVLAVSLTAGCHMLAG
jgi:hypothetical protein